MGDLKKLLSMSQQMPITRGSVIYFLLKNKELVYIGKSNTVHSRLTTHLHEKDFDDCRFIHVLPEHQDALELALIKAYRPRYNAQKLSPINPLEIAMLRFHSFEKEVIQAVVRKLPQPKTWGPVAFFDKRELVFGLYDDDDSEALSEDPCAHDDDCDFGFILSEYLAGEIKLTDEEFELEQESCTCEPMAIVLLPQEGFVSATINKSRLYDISECKELAEKVEEIQMGVLKSYGCNIEKLKEELKQAEDEHGRGQNYYFEGLDDSEGQEVG